MKSIHQAEESPETGSVGELLERRAQLEQWLARLSETDPETPARVVERVRADYLSRLDEVTAELSSHRTTIEAEVQRLNEELASVIEAHDQAVEALAEARLRQRIGELSEAEWETRRSNLEETVETAAASRASLEAETGRMRYVLAQLQAAESTTAAEPHGDRDQPAEGDDAAVLTVDLSGAGEEPMLDAEGELVLPSLEDFTFDDAADAIGIPGMEFLEELDRAISASQEERAGHQAASDAPADAGSPAAEADSTVPNKGLKCAECGYTNDPSAWYCGVCGVDLT